MSTIVLVRKAAPDSERRSALLVGGAPPDVRRRSATAARGRDEELMNSITHGLGLVLSIAGLSALVTLAGKIGTTRHTVGCGVYGSSLVMLYAASTLFHSWPVGDLKRVFLLLDHIGIYALIAGTYTPLALFASRGIFALWCLTLVWGFAIVGSFVKVVRFDRLDDDSSIPFFAMGGICVMSLLRLLANIPSGETGWLLAGGLCYLAGLLFFFNDEKRYYHSIWHMFVLAGSICHYRAVLGYAITETF
jgi:hemolysin III